MDILSNFLEHILNICYAPFQSYGIAIILFTLLSKIVLLPVSIWVQKNSIKMVRVQPEINEIKAQYYGDPDAIAERQSVVLKREGYNVFASLLPIVIQLVLLIAMIQAVVHGMEKEGVNLQFLGIDLTQVPWETGGAYYAVPIAAGISAWLLGYVQNKGNILQENLSPAMRLGTAALSVGISLVLGLFVPAGAAIYWIASNLFSIVQTWLLNIAWDPHKYVDYERLNTSKESLKKLEDMGKSAKRGMSKEERQREKEDYKRFFSIDRKKLVFYSEGSGFYKYYQGLIEYLLTQTNLVIHYVTSDPEDAIFELAKTQPQIRPYYIGAYRLMFLMMKMDADIVVMTMPDLETFHIKRSYVRKDLEYIYIPHHLTSLNLILRQGSVDHYDTIFVTGKHQAEEVRKTEEIYRLPKKRIIEAGSVLLDRMLADYVPEALPKERRRTVLIAASWQQDNLMDLCLEPLLDNLAHSPYRIIVRPHPQYLRHKSERIQLLARRYEGVDNIEVQEDFSSNDTVFNADVLITDWSGIAYEYAFTTCKPVLFVDTPMKVMNPEYKRLDIEPIDVWMRNRIGISLQPNEMNRASEMIGQLVVSADQYADTIRELRGEYIYSLGHSAETEGQYIIDRLQKKVEERKDR